MPVKAAYLSHPACARHEMGAGHPECPDRIAAIADRLLASGVLDFMDSFSPPAATRAQILRAHEARYFAELQALAPREGYAHLDPDTTMNPDTWNAALHAAGAVVMASELVVQGGYQRAFCNVRPPGHHAERGQAMGFCFFNNVAVGIRHALEALGLARVALIDFDVHHGNGSEDILAGDDRVLMVSTFQRALYPFSGEPARGENMHNIGLAAYSAGDAMRQVVTREWLPRLRDFRPQMLFISAGFDAHRDDDLAQLGWLDEDYAWVTRELVAVADAYAQGRIVSVLEGGYNLPALARSVEQHVRALLGID